MPLSKKSDTRPDAPTRLAENKKKRHPGDRFKSLIFHVAAPDLFLTINCNAKPELYCDFVVVKPPINGEIVLEIYDGTQEKIIGVVEFLEFFQLEQSEQWHPRIPSPFANFCILFFLYMSEVVTRYLT